MQTKFKSIQFNNVMFTFILGTDDIINNKIYKIWPFYLIFQIQKNMYINKNLSMYVHL